MPRACAAASSSELEELLGYRGRDEMIHRDDLVLHGMSADRRGNDGLDRPRRGRGRRGAGARRTRIARTRRSWRRRRRCARAPGEILAANARDMEAAEAAGLGGAMLDRLRARCRARRGDGRRRRADRDARRIPSARSIADWVRPNGLRIQRVRVPLGVIGIIYESRPNVTCDAGALCLKSGNAAILRGGSESHRSSAAIHACLVEGLRAAGLPEACIQLVPTTDRAAVGYMLGAHDRLHRRDRAARRQEPHRARAAGGPGAGDRPSRGQLPRVRATARRISTWRARS